MSMVSPPKERNRLRNELGRVAGELGSAPTPPGRFRTLFRTSLSAATRYALSGGVGYTDRDLRALSSISPYRAM
jgi:hypothetical protein